VKRRVLLLRLSNCTAIPLFALSPNRSIARIVFDTVLPPLFVPLDDRRLREFLAKAGAPGLLFVISSLLAVLSQPFFYWCIFLELVPFWSRNRSRSPPPAGLGVPFSLISGTPHLGYCAGTRIYVDPACRPLSSVRTAFFVSRLSVFALNLPRPSGLSIFSFFLILFVSLHVLSLFPLSFSRELTPCCGVPRIPPATGEFTVFESSSLFLLFFFDFFGARLYVPVERDQGFWFLGHLGQFFARFFPPPPAYNNKLRSFGPLSSDHCVRPLAPLPIIR